jgi:hypothetical protein
MLIIGFGHRARQGKNSAAVAMINASPVGSEVRMYAYADALRAEVKSAVRALGGTQELIDAIRAGGRAVDGVAVTPVNPDGCTPVLPSWVVAEDGKPRTILQWWGTDYRRAQDVNYWVRQLMERLNREQPDVALITDVRFPNEVDAIHRAGGLVVKVTRTTAPDIVVPGHASEDSLDGCSVWDFEIKAADLPELRKQAAAIYHKIVGS